MYGVEENVVVTMVSLISFLRVLAAFVTYFIVGGVYMYRVKGARGMEVVPHYAFWKDVPFLIKVSTLSSTTSLVTQSWVCVTEG